MPRHCASPTRIMCGTWVELYTINWSARSSHQATIALPSRGFMAWRASDTSRRTIFEARAAFSSKSFS